MTSTTQTKKKLAESFAALTAQIEALRAKAREEATQIISLSFKEFFEKYGDLVHAIYWMQYTPYFNDGEACEFSVNDPCIALKKQDEDEDYDYSYDGEFIYDQDDLESLHKKLQEHLEWKADPIAFATIRLNDYKKSYGRDPWRNSYGYSYMSDDAARDKWLREYKPHYTSEEDIRSEIAIAEKIIAQAPDLKKDFKEISRFIMSLDDDLMEGLYGDHVKVIVTADGVEVEEHDHD